jgi:predicted negative regulator of RcsB-dependent stress response
MTNNRTWREAAVLVVVVFVLGMVLGGLGTHYWEGRVWGARLASNGHANLVEQLTQQLELTSDQQKQLTSVIEDTRAQWRTLYQPLEAQHEQIRQQGRDRIRAILTPEQRPRFEEFVRRLDEERKKQPGR